MDGFGRFRLLRYLAPPSAPASRPAIATHLEGQSSRRPSFLIIGSPSIFAPPADGVPSRCLDFAENSRAHRESRPDSKRDQ